MEHCKDEHEMEMYERKLVHRRNAVERALQMYNAAREREREEREREREREQREERERERAHQLQMMELELKSGKNLRSVTPPPFFLVRFHSSF